MIERDFFIAVYQDGSRVPMGQFFPIYYWKISSLRPVDFTKPKNIENIIREIHEVINGDKEILLMGDGSHCEVWVEKDVMTFEVERPEAERTQEEQDSFYFPTSYTLSTREVVDYLVDWLEFLLKFEREEIPGLLYPAPILNTKGG